MLWFVLMTRGPRDALTLAPLAASLWTTRAADVQVSRGTVDDTHCYPRNGWSRPTTASTSGGKPSRRTRALLHGLSHHLYSRSETLPELDQRRRGAGGDAAHAAAVVEQRRVVADEHAAGPAEEEPASRPHGAD